MLTYWNMRELHGFIEQWFKRTDKPPRAFWGEREYSYGCLVIEQLEQIKRDGWRTAEEVVYLTPCEEDVLRFILRLKLGLADFTGPLTPANLGRVLRYNERAVQMAYARLEAVELLAIEREQRAVKKVKVSNFFWMVERPESREDVPQPPAETPRFKPGPGDLLGGAKGYPQDIHSGKGSPHFFSGRGGKRA